MTTEDDARSAAARGGGSDPAGDWVASTPQGRAFQRVNLNLNVRGLKPSATIAINDLSARLAREGREVFRLGLGQSPFPVHESVVESLRANAFQKDYLPVCGLPELREAVAGYHRRKHGIARSADNVLVGPGSKELMFLIQLVYYGDLVIPTPSWVSYAPQAQIIGRHVRWLPTRERNSWKLEPSELEALCRSDPDRPRLVILNYPNNPSGYTYTDRELAELAEVGRRFGVVMLSDEIYGETRFEGRHCSIAEFYPEGTIISSGLSKWCGAGGWRLGTFTFPDEQRWLLECTAAVASETFTSTSAPIQHAAVTAFVGSPGIEDYLVQCRRVLGALGRLCAAGLADAGLHLPAPDGAFYLFPSFEPLRDRLEARGISSSARLSERLLAETGVATIPGESCGRPPGELTLRIAYVDFDGGAAMEAVRELEPGAWPDEAFLRRHCPRVTTAIDRMRTWLAG